ncbi:MAG: type III-B CRISPR module RAMP protein Cmr6 [Thermoprotei archaeon]|nr:MAG: type III-B CRISPR module RAMP protein Cmr6 [Thermoprotei archaeon]
MKDERIGGRLGGGRIIERERITCTEHNLWTWIAHWSSELWKLKVQGAEEKYNVLKRRLAEKLLKAYSSMQLFKIVNNYLDKVLQALKVLDCTVIDVKLEFKSRAIVGVGATFARSAFEIGLAFDPLLNVPYIPGSSIKGAIRHGWRVIAADDLKRLEEVVFGPEPGHERSVATSVLFLDFYLVNTKNEYGRVLLPDVVTPHYTEDELDESKVRPNPVVYVSLADGIVFRGFIALTPFLKLEVKRVTGKDYSIQDIAKEIIKALMLVGKLGLGARTSVGYGKFEVSEVKLLVGDMA